MNMELMLLGTRLDAGLDAVQAREVWRGFRVANGWAAKAPLLSVPGSNLKVDKSALPTYSLSLAPSTLGGHNVCSFSTPDCRRGCVAFNGNGRYDRTMAARALRVAFLYANPSAFVALACAELRDGVAKHGRVGCRLNTFSDIPWEKVCPWLLSIPGVVFYDYTKNWARRSSPSYR